MKQTLRRVGWQALVFACTGAVACGGGAPAAMYRPPVDFDAGSNDAVPDEGGAAAPDGSSVDGAPAPVTGPGGRRILSGPVSFISNGPPCTNEAGSTGDVWCAVLQPSVLQPGSAALFVVNISQALAGTNVACGTVAGDPNCLMLTGGFAEDDTHQASFQGNTLVYYDFTATPYGWRPGMLNGRRLVVVDSDTGDVHDCVSAPRGDAVACLQDIPTPRFPTGGDPNAGVSSTAQYSNLLAGHAGPASPLLQKVDTVISSDADDDLQRFQFHFVGPASDRLAWSTRMRPGAPEVLKTQVVGDEASRQVIASDVSRWATSADFTSWGWLAAFNYDSQAPSGTLQLAPFPDGATPSTLLEATATFSFVAGHGMAVLSHAGELFGIADATAGPTPPMMPLDTKVLGVVAVSPAGHLAYVKSFDFVFRLVDLWVTKFDGTGTSCGLNRGEEVPFGSSLGPRFLPSSAALLWGRVTNLDTTDDRLIAAGKFTRMSDCATQTVEPDLVALGPLGQDGISLSDTYDGASGTLRIRSLGSGGDTLAPGEATLVQTHMDTSLSLYPALRAMVYTVNIGGSADGLYLRPIAGSAAN